MPAVGIFGGTFDPVHNGHIQLADAALSEYSLKEIIFIPAAWPPHKNGDKVADFSERLAMLRLAFSDREKFIVSDIEDTLSYPSYTIDTLRFLRNNQYKGCELFFVIGCDAFLELESWYRWDTLIKETNFLIGMRYGFKKEATHNFLRSIGFMPSDDAETEWFRDGSRAKIFFITANIINISSSQLRTMVAAHQSVASYIPKKVSDYIEMRALYRKDG